MSHLIADAYGTLGTEFVFNFPRPHYHHVDPILMISTPSTNTVSFNISVSGTGYKTSGTTTHNKHATINLPKSAYLEYADSVQEKAVFVTASTEVSVYGLVGNPHGDGFIAIPSNELGKKYFVLTYSGLGHGNPSELAVSAVEDETEVHINLPNAQTKSFTLNTFQSYQIVDAGDLTGSVIKANKPVAVVAGTALSNVGNLGSGADGLLEQLPPVESYGRNFVLTPFLNRPQVGYVYRIITPNNASITITNVGVVELQAGKIVRRRHKR